MYQYIACARALAIVVGTSSCVAIIMPENIIGIRACASRADPRKIVARAWRGGRRVIGGGLAMAALRLAKQHGVGRIAARARAALG